MKIYVQIYGNSRSSQAAIRALAVLSKAAVVLKSVVKTIFKHV